MPSVSQVPWYALNFDARGERAAARAGGRARAPSREHSKKSLA